MRLDYHSWKTYKECPRHFHWKHIQERPPTAPENRYFTLYGKLTEKFFQFYCNTWSKSNPELSPADIRGKLSDIYPGILSTTPIDWDSSFIKKTKEEVFEESFKDICAILQSSNKKLFLNTVSEWSITLTTKLGDELTGRLDFYQAGPANEPGMIFDGKGAGKIGKNVNKNQLLFYALLLAFHLKKMPSELGFFYYRFNSYVKVDFDIDTLNSFRAQISLDLKTIKEDKEFLATPGNKPCQYCEYNNSCPNVHKPKHRERVNHIPESVSSLTGIQQFGLE